MGRFLLRVTIPLLNSAEVSKDSSNYQIEAYMIRPLIALVFIAISSISASAQDTVWVQVEAQPTLSAAQARARAYAGQLENVSGYFLGGRWYGIVLGPYTTADAETLIRDLRRKRQIPTDSYVVDGSRFQQQFWPVGVGAQTAAQPLPASTDTSPDPQPAEIIETPLVSVEVPADIAPVIDPVQIPDETASQAQASEALLDRGQRMDLQTALQWAGFYDAAIDGAFGRGTRASMRAWQEAKNYEPTGILTTNQRAALFADYNAVLDGMNLQLVRDDVSGIEMLVPTGVVAFAAYEPPFVRFEAKGEIDAKVLFISQAGDQNRLYGLYEVMQTLAIVPPEGERKRGTNSFELEGIGGGIHSYTYAAVKDGAIKGFSLIWPQGDEARRSRILAEMQSSFTTINGLLDPALMAPSDDQSIDMISGLEVRQPKLSRSGFFVDTKGAVLTTLDGLEICEKITINGEHDADILASDAALGIAVLQPKERLSPLSVATFQTGVPRLQAEVAVAGFPYGGVLVTPSLTFGRLADLRGLNGEDNVKRLILTAQEGDAGGPVFDNGGAVLGMMMPRKIVNGQVLPPEVSYSINADLILDALAAAGVAAQTTDTVAFMPPETLTSRAAESTVLVSCW